MSAERRAVSGAALWRERSNIDALTLPDLLSCDVLSNVSVKMTAEFWDRRWHQIILLLCTDPRPVLTQRSVVSTGLKVCTSKCMHDMNQTEAEHPRQSKRSQTTSSSQIGPSTHTHSPTYLHDRGRIFIVFFLLRFRAFGAHASV